MSARKTGTGARARQHKQQAAESTERRRVLTALIVIAGLALALRVVGHLDYVFGSVPGDVFFRGNDAWYRWRLVENMAANWPSVMLFDPYTGYPDGTNVVAAPLMSWLVVGLARVVSIGTPSEYLLKVITALVPPLAGVAVIVPVYFIGREVWNRWTGVVAAGLVMLLPTQFLSRSMLGFADHHVLETLFSTLTIMCLVIGYKRVDWRWYASGGVALGLYYLSWHGAMFILAPLLLWLVVQYVCDMYRNAPWNGARLYGPMITAAVTLALFLPLRHWNADWQLSSLVLAGFAALPIVMDLVRLETHSYRQWWAVMLFSGGVAIAAIVVLSPHVRDVMNVAIDIAVPTHAGVRSIGETKALDLNYFLTVYAVNLLTAGAALYWTVKERHEFVLVAIWGAVMFLFTVSQMRWEYYLVVPLALLSAYGFVRLGKFVCAETKRGTSLITLVFLLFATSVASIQFAMSPSIMTEDWHEALVWMRENTPEPFGDNGSMYYELDSHEVADYAVVSWWDYGHFITSVAHRVPVSNPFQQNVFEVAEFLVNGMDYPAAQYVVIDADMVYGKWYALPLWLGDNSQVGKSAPHDSPIYCMWTGQYEGWSVAYRTETVVVLARDPIDNVVQSSIS